MGPQRQRRGHRLALPHLLRRTAAGDDGHGRPGGHGHRRSTGQGAAATAVLVLRHLRRLAGSPVAPHGLSVPAGPPDTGKVTLAQGLTQAAARTLAPHGVTTLVEVDPHALPSEMLGREPARGLPAVPRDAAGTGRAPSPYAGPGRRGREAGDAPPRGALRHQSGRRAPGGGRREPRPRRAAGRASTDPPRGRDGLHRGRRRGASLPHRPGGTRNRPRSRRCRGSSPTRCAPSPPSGPN